MNVWFFIGDANSPTGSGNLIFQLERDMNERRNVPHLVMHFSETEFSSNYNFSAVRSCYIFNSRLKFSVYAQIFADIVHYFSIN